MLSILSRLYYYNFLLSMSLTVAGGTVFLDLLMLRMRIDLATIGMVKSLTFFFPAALYQLCVPLLQHYQRNAKICAYSYLLRCLLPLPLPIAAAMGADSAVLTWMCAIILPSAIVLATFANNSLMIIYHDRLPPYEFNRCSGKIQALVTLPAVVLGLPIAKLLENFSSDFNFFLAFAVVLLLTGLLQIPAFIIMRGMFASERHRRDLPDLSLPTMLRPYNDPPYRGILFVTAMHALVSGCGTYMGIYCLKIIGTPVSHLYLLTVLISLLSSSLLPLDGKIADRIGYRRMFTLLGTILSTGGIIFAAWPVAAMLPLFALLCWDAQLSPAGSAMVMCEQAASSRLASDRELPGYIAAFNISRNAGSFVGALSAGVFFKLTLACGISEAAAFHSLFVICIPLLFAMTYAAHRFCPDQNVMRRYTVTRVS